MFFKKGQGDAFLLKEYFSCGYILAWIMIDSRINININIHINNLLFWRERIYVKAYLWKFEYLLDINRI